MGLPMPAPHVDYMYTLFVTNQGYAGITLIYSQKPIELSLLNLNLNLTSLF